MVKKFFILAILFLSWNPESYARQWLVFFAKDGFFDGALRQSFGHAYVGLIKEDTASKQNLLLACWGFYPKGGLQTSGIVGYMNGSIKNDWNSKREHSFVVEISEFELIACLHLKKIWEHKAYSLRANNCLHFLRNFGQIISRIKLPEGRYLLPSSYLNALRNNNRDIEYKGKINNIIPKAYVVKMKKAKMYSKPKDHPLRKKAWYDFVTKKNKAKLKPQTQH
ncbi:MAG: hypothetical protein IPI45_12950 [Saprospiraceae bacterium]|nr:hypothetical protein [Saprospiraceae bacterium]MBK7738674.1 hypothetical protein [Saprospiraceae bacterium]MBK7912754.1 hypothetical protein [Saprospiraceae bacterium]